MVPSCNHVRFVARCLHSILKQTLPPSELLVIDDGSQDGSAAVIASILKNCPFPCELIARANLGLCKTLNEGFTKTYGNYFCYLASDDLWMPAFLASRVALLDARPQASLAYGHVFIIDEQDRIVDSTQNWPCYARGSGQGQLWQGIGIYSPSVCFRRALLPKQPWNENARLEDFELYLRLSTLGEFAFDAQTLSSWRKHGNNTSGDLAMMLEECLAAQKRVAADVGMTSGELAQSQAALKWRWAESFTRVGDKRQAFELVRQNWHGAPSVLAKVQMFGRLLLPKSVLDALRQSRQRQMTARNGTHEV